MDFSVSNSTFADERLRVAHRNTGATASSSSSSIPESRSIQSIVGLLLEVMLPVPC
jgi:hypothetical protein